MTPEQIVTMAKLIEVQDAEIEAWRAYHTAVTMVRKSLEARGIK